MISAALRDSRLKDRSGDVNNLIWLTGAQVARLEPFFPRPHGKSRVDDRRVLSGIILISRNGLRWRDAPAAYGTHKTRYSRWKRWSEKGILAQTMAGLAAEHSEEKTEMNEALSAIGPRTLPNATYLKAHRTAIRLTAKKGDEPVERQWSE